MFLGTRIPNLPVVQEFHQYRLKKLIRSGTPPTPLDQTICRSSVIKDIGGFPRVSFAGMDSILGARLKASNWKVFVDPTITSVHLRDSLDEELRHFYSYGKAIPYLSPEITENKLKRLYYQSFFTAIKIAFSTLSLDQLWFYPKIRKQILQGFQDASSNMN
jgi:hypothetical protein